MPENKISSSIEQTYDKLEKILLENKCKITSKKPPYNIRATHGSLMGITPITAKKVITFNLSKQDSKTTISTFTQISQDWKNLTLYGNIISAFVIALFLWITNDLNHYLKTNEPGIWTWIAQITASQNNIATILTINLMQALAIFLTLVVIFEIICVIYVYPRKNQFAQKITQTVFVNH